MNYIRCSDSSILYFQVGNRTYKDSLDSRSIKIPKHIGNLIEKYLSQGEPGGSGDTLVIEYEPELDVILALEFIEV